MSERKVLRNTSTPTQKPTTSQRLQSSASKNQLSGSTKNQTPSALKNQPSSAGKNRAGASRLNTTVMGSRSPPRMKANLNVTASEGSSGQKVPSSDWALECDLAYSAYLRAQMTKCVAELSVKCQKEEVDDQLDQQGELLQRILNKNNKLENEVKDLEAEIDLRKLCSTLDKLYNQIAEVLQDYKVEDKLDQCIQSAERACDSLYLSNVKQLNTQSEYDEFVSAVERCCNALRKLKASIGDTTPMAVLSEKMNKFLELQDEFAKKQQTLSDVEKRLAYNLFKSISDKLAELRQV